jgi:hypothetical protein
MINTKYLYDQLYDYYRDLDQCFEDGDLSEELEEMKDDMYFEDILEVCTNIVELHKNIKDYA